MKWSVYWLYTDYIFEIVCLFDTAAECYKHHYKFGFHWIVQQNG